MSTRFYLGSAAAGYAPATKRGAWDSSATTLVRRLAPAPEGTASTAAVAETSAAAGYDVLLGRWVSDPALTSGTLSGTLTWVAGVAESDAAADLVTHVHAYVTAGDSDTVRGTLLADSIGATEWPTTGTGRTEGAKTVTSVAVTVGDRLVIEFGYTAGNASATSYTGTLYYGATGGTDLAAAATGVTTDPGWVELSGADGLFYPRISTLTDTFDGPTFNVPPWDGSYGAIDITAGRGRVPCAHVGGAPQYAAILSTPTSQTQRWHLADSAIFCEVPLVPGANGGGGTVYSHFAVTANANISGSYAGVFYNAVANMLVLQSATGFSDGAATYIPYDPVAHRWWRIRHAAGVLYWDLSPDGATWTNGRTLSPAPSWTNYNGLGVLLEATRDSGTNDYAAFDNVNTPAFVTHTGAATMSAASTMSASAVRATGGATVLTAASTLSAAATRGTSTAATLTAASSFSASGSVTAGAAVSLSAASALSASAVRATGGAAALTAASTLSADAQRTTGGAVTLTAASTLSASVGGAASASVVLSAASMLSTSAFRAAAAAATLTAGSYLTAVASVPVPSGGVPASPHTITVRRVPVSIARRPPASVTRR